MSRTEAARPFRDLTAKQILKVGREACRQGDSSQLRDAIAELDIHRATGAADRVCEELKGLLDALDPQSSERLARDGGRLCRHCAANTGDLDTFYCASCFPDLQRRIEEDVARIERLATNPYVGRSSFPERRLLQHLLAKQRDRLSILHWADSLEEAESFERHIFGLLRIATKQKAPRMSGRFSRSYHAVYLAWTLRDDSLRAQTQRDEVLVETLTAPRRWPMPAATFRVEHLRTPLLPRQADAALLRFRELEQDHLDRRRER